MCILIVGGVWTAWHAPLVGCKTAYLFGFDLIYSIERGRAESSSSTLCMFNLTSPFLSLGVLGITTSSL